MKKLQATLVCLVAFSGIPLSAQSVPYPFNDASRRMMVPDQMLKCSCLRPSV